MIHVPFISPVALQIGPLAIHWYGLMYVAAFLAFLILGRQRTTRQPWHGLAPNDVEDLLFWGMIGVIVGGRLGEVLFYQPGYYWAHPDQIIALWNGGMSFHGGLIGVLIATTVWAHRRRRTFLQVTDFIAPLVPLGLCFGRLGNFINGELWGRVAPPDLPWAMIFTRADPWPRHPSPLYQALGEGLTLFVVLWWFSARRRTPGVVSAAFLVGVGTLRFIAEYFREPDTGIFGFSYVMSMGQWLSLPLVGAGVLLWIWRITLSRQE
jgi:phosphatidylglycerol:prolipoprotein diacylglycerol transferase